MKTSRRKLGVALVAVALLSVVAGYFSPFAHPLRRQRNYAGVDRVLHDIYLATTMYMLSHSGAHPTSLYELYGTSIGSMHGSKIVFSKERLDEAVANWETGFVYLAELLDLQDQLPRDSVILAYEKEPESDGFRKAVFLDGSIQKLSEMDLQRRIIVLRKRNEATNLGQDGGRH